MGLRAVRRVVRDGRGRRLPVVPGITHERRYWELGLVVAGVDEVGCGAWAGPITYAACVLPSTRRMYKLRDSKQLDAARREQLAGRLRGFASGLGVGQVSNEEVDELGMSDARRLAASRALDRLPLRPDVVLLDGNWDFLSAYGTHNVRLVHGDAHSASIAAASIVAKVTRDAQMVAAAERFPAYGFASNKGYPTPTHRAALTQLGPTALHRHSWAPIRALREEGAGGAAGSVQAVDGRDDGTAGA